MTDKKIPKEKIIERYKSGESLDSISEDSKLSKSGLSKKIYRNTEYRQRSARKEKNCERCGQNFKPESSPEQSYCSRRCFTKSKIKSEKILVECENTGCEKTKEVTKNSFESQKNHYCSTDCFHDDRSRKMTGSENPNWKNGKSFKDYPAEFNKELKEKIRIKYNKTCQICGIAQENLDKKLDVHHLDENKNNLDKNNLVALCRKCHSSMQNSKQAEKLRRSKDTMSYKKGYRRENQCKKTLEKCGFQAERSYNPAYSSGDYFGLFDVIAMRSDKKPRLVQVKSNRTDGALKEILESQFIPEKHFEVEVWIAYDNQGWRIDRMNGGNWKTIIDERGSQRNFGELVKENYD